MPIPFKKDPIQFNQRLLFPSSVFDLLPNGHDCYVFDGEDTLFVLDSGQ
jgi:hypothetical protein